ncbi:MAG: hypothetical protein FJW40_01235 [Acidobacteria bacterium]|nr:hypothetical protein [Acidobacteriota bacterium]
MRFALAGASVVSIFVLAACGGSPGRPPRPMSALDIVPAPPGVVERAAFMEKAPCTRCHTVPLAAMSPVHPAAHWGVAQRHAPNETMQCQTCHADPVRGELRMLGGAPVGFDESHRLCGQCHARQQKDWAGGAHGKRATGWASARVAIGCTGCHNPHSPGFGRRLPAMTRKEAAGE